MDLWLNYDGSLTKLNFNNLVQNVFIYSITNENLDVYLKDIKYRKCGQFNMSKNWTVLSNLKRYFSYNFTLFDNKLLECTYNNTLKI